MLTYLTDWHTDAQYKIRPQHITPHAFLSRLSSYFPRATGLTGPGSSLIFGFQKVEIEWNGAETRPYTQKHTFLLVAKFSNMFYMGAAVDHCLELYRRRLDHTQESWRNP